MAKIKPGSLFNGTSGRIGNLVTYNLNGIQVVRTMPESFKKRKTSLLQTLHQNSFRVQHAIAKSVKRTLIDKIWSQLSSKGGLNPYNQFIKRNRAAFAGGDRIVFPELMVVSDGSLVPAPGFSVKKEGDLLTFTWDSHLVGKGSSNKDKLNIIMIVCRNSLCIVEIESIRSDGEATLPYAPGNDPFTEGFAFWSSENEDSFSPSVYWMCR